MEARAISLSTLEKTSKQKTGLNTALTSLLILLFDVLMLWVATSRLSNEQAIICVVSLMSSFGPVSALAALGSTLQNTLASGNRVLDILEEKPFIEDVTGKDNEPFGDIQVEHVEFAYKEEPVLKNLSMRVPENHIVGIVGKSGSGKSTLLKLLMRFWEPQKGNISINNISLQNINTDHLRDMESYVTQDTHLFHDSILNNIRIAKLDASDEEVMEACRKASIHDFIMSLPNAYETNVGELGDSLSSGERQRIGLARAFLHQSECILLDEPTSNLDSLNEATILKSLDDEKDQKTIVIVSHRSSTMRIAESILEMEGGRFVGEEN